MARSLTELINFLLAEIALCGASGATPADILRFVDEFYQATPADSNGSDGGGPAPGPERKHNPDRLFKEKVWTWLTRNPEVSVGKKKQGHGLSLSEIEALYQIDPTLAQNETTSNVGSGSQPPADADNGAPRIFVSEERTWLAVAGHNPDSSKVLPSEFALLSIIAAHRSQGIVQPELVKLSGQDKRSVPKRTDSLNRKGYIEKRPVQFRNMRTSLCTLRKFIRDVPSTDGQTNNADASGGTTRSNPQDEIIDLQNLVNKILGCLKEFQVITRNDLKMHLQMNERRQAKILSRAIRKLERIGVCKRVRAKSQYTQMTGSFHQCIMLAREPTEKDLTLFIEDSRSLLASIEQEEVADVEVEDELDGDVPATDASSALATGDRVEDLTRTVPRWTPDRTLSNLVLEIIREGGLKGLTNADIKRACFGHFFRRPLESLLTRIVECWQFSQPLHIRHLAVVRDTALRGTITLFVHYSFPGYKTLVENGQASWDAVEYSSKDGRNANIVVPPISAQCEYDEFGFPSRPPPPNLHKDGHATLEECSQVPKPSNVTISSFDAQAVRLKDGTFAIRQGIRRVPIARLNYDDSSKRRVRFNSAVSGQEEELLPMNRKRKQAEIVRGDYSALIEEGHANVPKRRRSSRKDEEDFKGMSEKEILEAKGLDESWTEYAVFLIERPGPGVYVTPLGRRRPAGKRQGRPRISRIAVFKSPKLKDLDWFGNDGEINGRATNTRSNLRVSEVRESSKKPATRPDAPSLALGSEQRPRKRKLDETAQDPDHSSTQQSNEHPVAEAATNQAHIPVLAPSTPRKRGRPPKKRQALQSAKPSIVEARENGSSPNRGNTTGSVQPPISTPQLSVEIADNEPRSPSVVASNKNASLQGGDESMSFAMEIQVSQGQAAGNHNSAKGYQTPKLISSEREDLGVGIADIGAVDPELLRQPSETKITPGDVNGRLLARDASLAPSVTILQTPEPTESSPEKTKTARAEVKGGSVGLLRRRIVLDILEKSGGAYPLGSELWYPFTTAWMKSKHSGKPDLRTIKATVKYLADTGKLRQVTFSGRDSKGLITTKSIITKPDVHPSDPIVLNLQHLMLAEDSQYFPPGPEIDSTLRKSQRVVIPGRPSKKLDTEEDVTVMLQRKPASILAREFKKEQSALRRLRHGSGRPRLATDGGGREGVFRLQRIQKATPLRPYLDSLACGMPYDANISRQHGVLQPQPYAVRRLHPFSGLVGQRFGPSPASRKRSAMRLRLQSLALLLIPEQDFHAVTGTFSTAGYIQGRTLKRKVTDWFPENLDVLLASQGRHSFDFSNDDDPVSSQFFSEVDTVQRWELQHEDKFDLRVPDWQYIIHKRHKACHTVPLEGPVHLDVDLPTPPSPEVVSRATRQRLQLPRPDWAPVPSTGEDPSFNDFRRQRRAPRPRNRRLEKLREEAISTTPDRAAMKTGIVRRNRAGRNLPETMIRKMKTAIVVVRTLAGGLEGKMIDWDLVAKVFPQYEPKVVFDRGKAILSKNRLQIAKMQSDFQERYIEAYDKGKVPPIDYRNLEAYDWERVVNWATKRLDVPLSQKLPSLPATRDKLDSLFEIRPEPLPSLDEIYNAHSTVTIPRKHALMAGVPFAVPLQPSSLGESPKETLDIARLNTAKSWVRANIIAADETYDQAQARRTLDYFGENLAARAVQSLITDRAITVGKRGRISPGRNYDVTDFLLQSLGRRRAIESVQLKRALRFKVDILDRDLRMNGKSQVRYEAEDGDILALINLTVEGRIKLMPIDPPKDKYGLTDGGYLTRLMDKNKLRFEIDVFPVPDKYVYGNPVEQAVTTAVAPRGDMDRGSLASHPIPPPSSPGELPGRVPIWYDIHLNFVKVTWDLVVAAVVGCVAARPGIGAGGITRVLKVAVGQWEVELLLGWLQEVDVIERTRADGEEEGTGGEGGAGWTVKEWWWLIVGD